MNNDEIPGSLNLQLGKSYKVLLQYGLFNDADDFDKSKVRGALAFSDALTITLPTSMKTYISSASALPTNLAFSTLLLLGCTHYFLN